MKQSSNLKFWFPALVGMTCLGLSMGLVGIYGFFVDPLVEEFSVSRAVINVGPIFLLIMPAFIGPIAGKMADKVSIRNLLLLGAVISMASLYAMSYANSFRLLTLGFIFCALGMVFYGPITVNAFLVKHYRSQAGRALAIAAMGISLASAVLPLLTAWLMESYSWRDSLSILAVFLLLILLTSILFGLGRGEKSREAVELATSGVGHETAGSDFLRQPVFWIIGLAVAIVFSSSLVIAVCYPPHFINIGFDKIDAGLFLTAGGIAGLTGKVIIAAIVDRVQSRLNYFVVLLLVIQILGYVGLLVGESYYSILLAVMLAGFGGGAFIPMPPILNNYYFDADIIGRVSGAQAPMMLPLGLIGLPLSGYVFDQTGSYRLVIITVIVIFSIAAILFLKLPKKALTEGVE